MTAPVIARIDLYPANLNLAGEMYPNVRVIVTADEIYAFKDGQEGQGPVQFLHERIADFDGRNTIGYTAALDDGREAVFQRSTGCGCGSRLRGYRPFPQGLSIGQFG